MKKKSLKVLSTVLATTMVFSLAGCGGSGNNDTTPTPAPTQGGTNDPAPTQGGTNDPAPTSAATDETTPTSAPNDTPKEIITLRFGTHHVPGLDPHYTDEITGEYAMPEDERNARYAAEQAILDEYGVVFEYLQFSGNTTEALLQSVMANDPVCDIAWMWGGSEGVILAQNILQKLDDYAYIFTDDPEASWMLYDKVFDHYYFLGANLRTTQRWPLVYNISYIEEVDSLKDENGNTIYPNQLYLEGKWTWSTFKDYLAKIEAYYANSSTPNRPERRIEAYETDYRFAALSAAYSNGGGIYDSTGMIANSPQTKEAVAYIKELMDANLLVYESWNGLYQPGQPGWLWNGGNFGNGESVFTDCHDWGLAGASEAATKRGESIGIVPWPRPDNLDMDDPRYQQVVTASDSMGILKGISPEKTELALKALSLFYRTFYTARAGVDSIEEYRSAASTMQAAKEGFDVFNENVGEAMQETYRRTVMSLVNNDFADLFAIRAKWDDIVMDSIFGFNGTPSYDVAIDSRLNELTAITDEIKAVLGTEGIHDNVVPVVNLVSGDTIAFPAGTSFDSINWADYIYANDNADGDLPISGMKVIWNTEVDFNVVGKYEKAFLAEFADSTGNTASREISFVIYNPDNTTAPVVTVIAEPETVALDSNASDISWVGKFIESPTDADGLDISKRVKADLSGIDTTTPGTYNVTITVTDYAGNETAVDVEVTVE